MSILVKLKIEKLKNVNSGKRCFEIDFLKSANSRKTQNRKKIDSIDPTLIDSILVDLNKNN